MSTQKFYNIGNHTSVSEILKILKENNVDPAMAEVQVETYTDHNSYGDSYPATEVYLVWYENK